MALNDRIKQLAEAKGLQFAPWEYPRPWDMETGEQCPFSEGEMGHEWWPKGQRIREALVREIKKMPLEKPGTPSPLLNKRIADAEDAVAYLEATVDKPELGRSSNSFDDEIKQRKIILAQAKQKLTALRRQLLAPVD
jgi:hypothetical protein